MANFSGSTRQTLTGVRSRRKLGYPALSWRVRKVSPKAVLFTATGTV
jgi:hypothetical protein